MSESLVKVYLHIIFSTKYRQHLIDECIESDLHAYMGGICNKLECIPIKIGGYTDHIHILCTLSKKIAIVKLLEEVKKQSSVWIKTKSDKYRNFYWQDGYGVFSLHESDVESVIQYISNQKSHHQKKTFQEEFSEILKHYNIDFDEKYVWG